MKLLKLITILVIFLSMGCSKDETIKSDCIASMLSENNMIEYSGQELGCKSFLELFHHKNKQFFLLGNHCADIMTDPIDCEGNSLRRGYKNFYNKAERIGIVGIDE
ncbi:MAG: hypothetical protein AAF738_00585 [Bacteroidota bacterium]